MKRPKHNSNPLKENIGSSLPRNIEEQTHNLITQIPHSTQANTNKLLN